MLVNMREVINSAYRMKDGKKEYFAVGAFNAYNLESLQAIIGAAEETGHGVIINYAEVHAPLIPMEEAVALMILYAKKSKVPICLNLDHGTTVENCIKAINLGFTSVMIDASAKSFEENIKTTSLVTNLAHLHNVSVEAELGHVITSDIGMGLAEDNLDEMDPDKIYTNPDEAKQFVDRTHVDALAVTFGTAHGIYKVKPKLDLNRVALIHEKTPVPLVMHGGSGLSKEEFQTAIRNGIRKVNYYTYMTLKGGKAVKDALDAVQDPNSNIFFHDLPIIAREAMKEDVKAAIRMFSLED